MTPERLERSERLSGGAAADGLTSRLRALADRECGAALVLGAAVVLTLPPLNLWPLIVAFAGLLVLLVRAEGARRSFLLGWWFGFGFFVAGLYWIGIAFFTDAERFGLLAVPAVMLLCAVMAVFPGIAGWLFALQRWRHPLSGALVLAGSWVLSELLRAHFLWGFPWNLIGYAWVGAAPVDQLGAYVGVYGLSFLTVLAGSLPASLLLSPRKARLAGPLIAASVVSLAWIAGSVRLPEAAPEMVPDIRLRLVQGNVAQEDKWDRVGRAEVFDRHLALSGRDHGAISHVIWPESAAPYLLEADESARAMIAEVVPKDGLLLTGGNRYDPSRDPPAAWNSLFVLDSNGTVRARYDKHRLVPFGEFLPWRDLLSAFGLKKVTEGTIDFLPGDGPATVEVEGLPPFSPLICYEVIFTGDVVDAKRRPSWLLNITNDAWFGQSSGPYQHLAMARLRAIEQGLPLIRSANSGISAIIDPHGRVIASLGLNMAGVLDSGLPAALAAPPIYARLQSFLAALW